MTVLYIAHYGTTPKYFFVDQKTGKLRKKIGDGGSNIHINLIKYIDKKKEPIIISTFKDNYQYLAFFEYNSNVKFVSYKTPQNILTYYNQYLENLYKSLVFPVKLLLANSEYDRLISVTDFLPDVISAFVLKIKNPRKFWIASYFLQAPRPWAKVNPYRTSIKRFLEGFIYWFFQQISYFLIRIKADMVLVTSEPDRKKFAQVWKDEGRVVVCEGGIGLGPPRNYFRKKQEIDEEKKIYDACFVGRFHCQKGVLELIKIWYLVCKSRKKAKLAMIGMGSLEDRIRKDIEDYHLEKNVDLLGYLEGRKKYKIFRQSKIIVHPAVYDSGGMAAAEGMAWGLPGVSFDLESLKTYYPKGMLKTPCFNLKKFAGNIVLLLTNQGLYREMSKEAAESVKKWGWNKRGKEIFDKVFSTNRTMS